MGENYLEVFGGRQKLLVGDRSFSVEVLSLLEKTEAFWERQKLLVGDRSFEGAKEVTYPRDLISPFQVSSSANIDGRKSPSCSLLIILFSPSD
jgi:hypothetical protein